VECGLIYPVKDGIPVIAVDEAEKMKNRNKSTLIQEG
jgi:uncharacterized protein YbaR (Trm112 family)